MRRLVAIAAVVIAGCAHPPPARTAPATITMRPALPKPFAFEAISRWPGDPSARLRLDGGGRPYLVTATSFVPLARLPSGAEARPFRIAGVAAIADVAWVDDGVMLLVVDHELGHQLGTVGEHGFSPILELPAGDMSVVSVAPDKCWLFAPRSTGAGRLYLYDKAGTLTEMLRAPAAIHAVSGPPDRAYVAIDSSIVRLSSTGAAELVFDGGQPIMALAAAGAAGVVFSTSTGTFFLSNAGSVLRLTGAGATAIATHGDDVFLVLPDRGLVHGAPVSALAAPPGVK